MFLEKKITSCFFLITKDEQEDDCDEEQSIEEEENGPDEGLFNHERNLLLLDAYKEFYDDLRKKHSHHYSIWRRVILLN